MALSVTDLDASIAFYSVLDFKPIYRWQAEDRKLMIAHLKQGQFLLELFCFSKRGHFTFYLSEQLRSQSK